MPLGESWVFMLSSYASLSFVFFVLFFFTPYVLLGNKNIKLIHSVSGLGVWLETLVVHKATSLSQTFKNTKEREEEKKNKQTNSGCFLRSPPAMWSWGFCLRAPWPSVRYSQLSS